MKAELIKTDTGRFDLYMFNHTGQAKLFASTNPEPGIYSLSLIRCKCIEYNIDLDEAIDGYGTFIGVKTGRKINEDDFIAGIELVLNSINVNCDKNTWTVKVEFFKAEDLKSVSNDWDKINKPKLDENNNIVIKLI